MIRTGLSIYVEAARRVWDQWLRYLTTHVAATALAALALWPVFAMVSGHLVRLSGSSTLTDLQIARFFVSPLGLAVMLAIGTALITVTVFETATMMAIDMADRKGQRAGPMPAVRFILRRIPVILRFGIYLSVRVLLMCLPALLVMGAAGWFLLTGHDINYYLTVQPPEFWVAGAIIGLTAVVAAVFIIRSLITWALALPLTLFARMGARAAFGRSEYIIATRRPGVAPAMIAWAVASFLIASVTSALLYFVAKLIIPEIDGSMDHQALALICGSLIWIVINTLLQAFNNATLALSLNVLMARGSPELVAEAEAPKSAHGSVQSKLSWAVIAVLAGSAGLGAIAGFPLFLERITTPDSVEVIAHRGGAANAPENTMAAIEGGIADGADWLEIDVQELADGTVVVIHDRDFMRQAGEPVEVWRATPEDIEGFDIGSWFGPEFAGERVRTLEDVLLAAKGRAKVLIELKYYGHAERLEESVAEIVEATGMTDSVAAMSLDRAGALKMKELRPDWQVGLLTAQAIGDLTRVDLDFLAVNAGMANRSFINRAHSAGKPVYVWTINDRAAMSRMLSLGVDGLITDRPALARQVLEEREKLDIMQKVALIVGDRLGVTD